MKVLVVGAHHDDVEIGCGGTLARLAREGHEVLAVVLTDSATSYELRGIYRDAATARRESARAAEVLGVRVLDPGTTPAANGELVYDVRTMRALETLLAQHEIDLVLTHWQHDLNTDHTAAARLVITAARHVGTVLSFRSNWYQPGPPFNGIILSDISATLEVKRRALACFEGEIASRGQAWIDSFIEDNRSLGQTLGVAAVEAFEPVRVRWATGAPPA